MSVTGTALRSLSRVWARLPSLGPSRSTPNPLLPNRLLRKVRSGVQKGYAFLPVTIQGHAGTILLNLNDEGDLKLST